MSLTGKILSVFQRLFATSSWRTLLLTSTLILAGLLDVLSILSAAPALELIFAQYGVPLSATTQRLAAAFTHAGIPFTFPWVVGLLGIFVVVKFLSLAASTAFATDTRIRFEEKLKQDSFQALLGAEWRFFTQESSGKLINTLTTESAKAGSATVDACRLLSFALQSVFQIGALFIISWRLTLISLVVLFPAALVTRFLYKSTYRYGTAAAKANHDLFGAIAEYLHLMKVIKGYAAERQTYAMYNEKLQTYKATMFRCDFLPQVVAFAMEPFNFFCVLSIAFMGLKAVHLPIALISVFLFTLYRLVPTLSQISVTIARLTTNLPGLEAIDRFMERARHTPREFVGTLTHTLAQRLSFESVSFAYQADQPILKAVSLELPANRMIALTGISGSGKSTLVDLLMGFHIPQEGHIRIDGLDLNRLDLGHWRSQIGYVPQEAMLFHDTIFNNVAWAAPQASRADVLEACRHAYVHEFAERSPQGYDTLVGEKGLMLSGGQRQRVAIARALARKPSLLILDEATSALDNQSERYIHDLLRSLKGHLTILIIAHRLSTIRDCDEIYVLDHGAVVERGTYESLVQANGRFRQLTQAHEA